MRVYLRWILGVLVALLIVNLVLDPFPPGMTEFVDGAANIQLLALGKCQPHYKGQPRRGYYESQRILGRATLSQDDRAVLLQRLRWQLKWGVPNFWSTPHPHFPEYVVRAGKVDISVSYHCSNAIFQFNGENPRQLNLWGGREPFDEIAKKYHLPLPPEQI